MKHKSDLRVDNPCVGVCSTTTVGSIFCVGCHRHYKDVIGWNGYTLEQKIVAMGRAVDHRLKKQKGEVDDHTDYLMGKF